LNSFFTMFGIESWKPVLTALLLPPVPFLVLMLIGARLILPRRGLGWLVILLSVALMWLAACTGTAQLLSQFVLHPPAPLTSDRIKELKSAAQAKTPTAIIVLGGGVEPFAPEYGVSNLYQTSLERLRFGIWLARETGLPLGFSGGVGWSQPDSKAEAQIAAQIAATEFNRPLKWIEDGSRDTRENALRTVALLRPAGIRHIVLVTNGWHMPRAQRAFETAAAGSGIRIEAAPMGLARGVETAALTWLPSSKGLTDVRSILRELLGRAAGA
jgi:uncharacterized SAM-binding protein YcdF (DUF218 family)